MNKEKILAIAITVVGLSFAVGGNKLITKFSSIWRGKTRDVMLVVEE